MRRVRERHADRFLTQQRRTARVKLQRLGPAKWSGGAPGGEQRACVAARRAWALREFGERGGAKELAGRARKQPGSALHAPPWSPLPLMMLPLSRARANQARAAGQHARIMADPGAVNDAGVASLDRWRHRLRERRALLCAVQTDAPPRSSPRRAPAPEGPRGKGRLRALRPWPSPTPTPTPTPATTTETVQRGERSCSDKECLIPDAAARQPRRIFAAAANGWASQVHAPRPGPRRPCWRALEILSPATAPAPASAPAPAAAPSTGGGGDANFDAHQAGLAVRSERALTSARGCGVYRDTSASTILAPNGVPLSF